MDQSSAGQSDHQSDCALDQSDCALDQSDCTLDQSDCVLDQSDGALGQSDNTELHLHHTCDKEHCPHNVYDCFPGDTSHNSDQQDNSKWQLENKEHLDVDDTDIGNSCPTSDDQMNGSAYHNMSSDQLDD